MFSSGTNGQAGGQASFSFGGGPTSFGAPPASNPFSVDTSFGGNSQAGTNGFNFGGFGAGGGGTQTAPSFGGFGAQQNTSTPASKPASSGLFGQSTAHITSPADDSMQTSPDTKPKGASIFAAKPPTGGSAPANPFAGLSGQNSNIFAPKPASTEQAAASSAEPQPFKPLFGAPAASKPDEAKSKPAVSNPFAPKPASDGAAASNPFANLSGQSSANLFAPKPAAEQTPAKPAEVAKPFSGLFGSTSTTKPSEPASNPFAPKPTTEGSAASNPFASLSTSKVTGTESAGKAAETQPFKPMFGTPAVSKTLDAGKETNASPAFGNMFATPKPAAENAASKPAETQPFKSLFGTPAPAKTTDAGNESSASPAFGNMFATPKPATENAAPKPAENQPFKSMFGTPVTSKPAEVEKEQPGTSNIFAPKVTDDKETPEPAKAQPFGSMFGASSAPAISGEEQKAATPSNPFANLSGQSSFSSPFAPKTTEQTIAQAQPSASLFGSSTASKPEKEQSTQEVEKNNTGFNNFTSSFSSSQATSQPPQQEDTTLNATPRASFFQTPSTEVESCLPSSSFSSSSSSSLPSSSTSIPTIYPYDISNTRSVQEADSLFPQSAKPASIEYPDMPLKSAYPPSKSGHPAAGAAYIKLCMLTEAFKQQVAKCDPWEHNIDEVLILYGELRRELGIPIGAIDLAEESRRAGINHADAVKEGHPAKQAVPPSPSTFTPPPIYPGKKADTPANASSGASDTANKFKQSFSSPSASLASAVGSSTPAPASAAANPFAPAVVPATNALATPAVIAAESAGDTPAAPASNIPMFSNGTASSSFNVPAPAFSMPKFGGDTNGATSSAPKPVFEIPKFGGGAGGGSTGGIDFMSQFKANAEKTAAEEKAKRKAEDFDSDEDDEAEWERKDAEQQRERRAKLEAASSKRSVFVPGEGFKLVEAEAAPSTSASTMPKLGGDMNGATSSAPKPAFEIPKFGGSGGSTTGGIDFMSQFKANAEKTAAEEKAKRKAEDFDSDEDDEAEWERKDAEQQREKRAKLEAASNKRTVFVPGKGFQFVDAEATSKTPAESTPKAPSPAAAVEPTSSAPAPSAPLFGSSNAPSSSKSLFGSSTTSASTGPVFGTAQPSPASASLFGAKPAQSNSMFAPSSTSSSTSSVFGSAQPLPVSQNIFGGLQQTAPKRKPSADESDKEDETPFKNSKASAPASAAGGGLFGRVSNPATPALTPPVQTPSPVIGPFTIPPPAEKPSVATPPAASEAASTAVATTEDGEGEPGEFFNLTQSNVGEEEENVELEVRARAFKLDGSWKVQGTGVVRLLKHPVTGRARIVLRTEPSGNVILNALLKKEYKYEATKGNSVQVLLPDESGKFSQWAVRVKPENLDKFFAKINEIKY
jgi:hypothetical protein